MGKVDKDELFKNLTDFLKVKGIEVKDGSYPAAIRQDCSILVDTINLIQKALGCAKAQVDKTLEQMRQTAPGQKTAPQPPPGQAPPPPPAGEPTPTASCSVQRATFDVHYATMKTRVSSLLTSSLMLAFAASSAAQGIELGDKCVVSFATTDMARNVLTNRDEFVNALSPFDRAARLKTDRVVEEAEFLEFVGQSALPWLPEETNRLAGVLQTVRRRVEPFHPPFPDTVLLIKTSGREEGNACYTRQHAIVLTRRDVRAGAGGLEGKIIHELFHVASRHDADLRARLYRLIGFGPISSVEYPGDLRARRITNPDGVQTGWCINVTNQNQSLPVVPILYASTARYDPQKGGEFFNYLVFQLLVVTKSGERWQPKLVEGQPELLQPRQVQGFFEQVGNNTDYIIHPDEILAENFERMARGETNLPTPRIVAEMKRVFAERRPRAK